MPKRKHYFVSTEQQAIYRERYRRTQFIKYTESRRLVGIRSRCKVKGISCDLTLEFLVNLHKTTTHCPYFNLPLKYGKPGRDGDDWAQLDRKDPLKGYTQDNVEFISFKANRLKSNATLKDLEQIIFVLKHNKL